MSLLRETLESGKFAVTTEMAPPKGTDLSHLLECAKPLVGRVHAANVTDFQSAVMRTTSLATCKLLKEAKNIELEYDSNSDKQDKYDRHLVWVFIDDKLLQEEVIKEGLAEVAYLYDEYKYTDRLIQAQDEAKKEGKNLWMEEETTPDYIIIIILTLAIIAFILKEKTK